MEKTITKSYHARLMLLGQISILQELRRDFCDERVEEAKAYRLLTERIEELERIRDDLYP